MATDTDYDVITDYLGDQVSRAAKAVHNIAYLVTDGDIQTMRDIAMDAGDDDSVALCDAALAGDIDARDEVKEIILDERYEQHDWGFVDVRDAVAALAGLAYVLQYALAEADENELDAANRSVRDAARKAGVLWSAILRKADTKGSDEVAELSGIIVDVCGIQARFGGDT